MNVASARNCVSTSHFAAATCHYCTITVCLLSLCRAQASQSGNHSLDRAQFLQKKKGKTHFFCHQNSLKNLSCGRLYRIHRVKKILNFFLSLSSVDFARSTSLSRALRASINFRNANLVRTSTLYIWILLYSLTTDWTLSVLCVDGHAWRSLYPVWYVSTFILLIILHY